MEYWGRDEKEKNSILKLEQSSERSWTNLLAYCVPNFKNYPCSLVVYSLIPSYHILPLLSFFRWRAIYVEGSFHLPQDIFAIWPRAEDKKERVEAAEVIFRLLRNEVGLFSVTRQRAELKFYSRQCENFCPRLFTIM